MTDLIINLPNTNNVVSMYSFPSNVPVLVNMTWKIVANSEPHIYIYSLNNNNRRVSSEVKSTTQGEVSYFIADGRRSDF